MGNNFALVKASRRLGNYLSREKYTLDRMSENTRVTKSAFILKVERYNDLVESLNDLFSQLTGFTEEMLFDYYISGYEHEIHYDDTNDGSDAYVSYAERRARRRELMNNETEQMINPSDVSGLMHESSSRMDDALREYKQNSPSDVSLREPEENDSAMVIKSEENNADIYTVSGEHDNSVEFSSDSEALTGQGVAGDNTDSLSSDERKAFNERIDSIFNPTNFSYAKRTDDNQDVNQDPTQIADVQTAVEREAKTGQRSHDIPIDDILSDNVHSSPIVDDVIDEELQNQMVNQKDEPVNYEEYEEDTGNAGDNDTTDENFTDEPSVEDLRNVVVVDDEDVEDDDSHGLADNDDIKVIVED